MREMKNDTPRARAFRILACLLMAAMLAAAGGCSDDDRDYVSELFMTWAGANGFVKADGDLDLWPLMVNLLFHNQERDLVGDAMHEAAAVADDILTADKLVEQGLRDKDEKAIRTAIKYRPSQYTYYNALCSLQYAGANNDLFDVDPKANLSNRLLAHPFWDAHLNLPADFEESDERAAKYGERCRLDNLKNLEETYRIQLLEQWAAVGGEMRQEAILRMGYITKLTAEKRASITKDPADLQAAQKADGEYKAYYQQCLIDNGLI
jgi:hypothetical protein